MTDIKDVCGDPNSICRKPKFRGRTEELEPDAGFSTNATADMYYMGLNFSLVHDIGEKKTLSACDGSFERDRTSVFRHVKRFGFFVERLLFGV